MLKWSGDQSEILRGIVSQPGKFKIILKTKDDPILLPKWIAHHLGSSPDVGVIIADNVSNDPEVLSIYDGLPENVVLFSYTGHHNLIHSRSHFPELYQAIAESAEHYIILDTDEQLLWTDGMTFASRNFSAIKARLVPGKAYPLPWLPNRKGSEDTFVVEGKDTLCRLTIYGKPIIPSIPPAPKLTFDPLVHNVHVPRHWYSEEPVAGLFVLHLNQYSKEQRLRANENKLRARGVEVRTPAGISVSHVNADSHRDHTVKRLINEIQDLLNDPASYSSPADLSDNEVRFLADGRIVFGSPLSKERFQGFLTDYRNIVGIHLGSIHERDARFSGVSADDMRAALVAAIDANDEGCIQGILNTGLVDHPFHLDTEGHPFFRKELIRRLLSKGDFGKAEGFYPIPGSPGGNQWHDILVARALDEAGDVLKATSVWQRVLAHQPANKEAMARLGQT